METQNFFFRFFPLKVTVTIFFVLLLSCFSCGVRVAAVAVVAVVAVAVAGAL